MGFTGAHKRFFGLLYEEALGRLQVSLALDVRSAMLYPKHVGRTGRTTHPLFLMLWPFRRCPFLGGIFILFGCTLHRACHGLYILSV